MTCVFDCSCKVGIFKGKVRNKHFEPYQGCEVLSWHAFIWKQGMNPCNSQPSFWDMHSLSLNCFLDAANNSLLVWLLLKPEQSRGQNLGTQAWVWLNVTSFPDITLVQTLSEFSPWELRVWVIWPNSNICFKRLLDSTGFISQFLSWETQYSFQL